jgi:hypothetical protein
MEVYSFRHFNETVVEDTVGDEGPRQLQTDTKISFPVDLTES